MLKVLVVDDSQDVVDILCDIIRDTGGSADIALTAESAKKQLSEKKFDIILLDLNLAGYDGFDLLKEINALRLESKTIIISGSMGVHETVKAMKLGASDCFQKPFNTTEIVNYLKGVAATLVSELEPADNAGNLIGTSAAMLKVKKTLRDIIKAKKTTVIITGETGTGKEVVARRLHDQSSRKAKPFVAVNCSAIPASLIESELFGHEKGAFTDARSTRRGYFELAGEGTLFLDEIGDFPFEYQGKLLRALQERSFRRVGGAQELPLDATVVAATNVDLLDAVKNGKFREDLYYRLLVLPVHLPPLREREGDVLVLAEYFLKHFSAENACPIPPLSEFHKQSLVSHTWPGNIRELRNVMERFLLLGKVEFAEAKVHKPSEAVKAPPEPAAAPAAADREEERRTLFSLLKKLMDESAPPGTPEPGA